MPKVSIITPVYNGAKYIAETLDTVLVQSFKDWELIIMDGASKDNTLEILKSYTDFHSNIHVFSAPDEGPYDAIHKGLSRAQGDYIFILCASDGYMNDDWLTMCVEKMDKDPELSVVWGIPFDMTEDGNVIGPHFMYAHFLEEGSRSPFIKEVLRRFKNPSSVARFVRKMNSATIATAGEALAMKKGKPLEKKEWFDYWLKTGTLFPDGNMCVARRVLQETLPLYKTGTRESGDLAGFFYNVNARGYLAACIPVAASVSRRFQPGSVTSRVQAYNDEKQGIYLKNITALRETLQKDPHAVVFRDRRGEPIDHQFYGG
jgi:glycosyltransferase involved in cell wall biosynthesis